MGENEIKENKGIRRQMQTKGGKRDKGEKVGEKGTKRGYNNNNNNNLFPSKKAWPVGDDSSIMYKYYTTLQCYSGYLANDRLIFS